MSSRGRKAPGKAKSANKARKAPPRGTEGTPGAETKPTLHQLHTSASATNLLRTDSDAFMDGSQSGIATPPLGGVLTPAGANGLFGGQGDSIDIDGPSINGLPLGHGIGDDVEEDPEYKIWKQVTK